MRFRPHGLCVGCCSYVRVVGCYWWWWSVILEFEERVWRGGNTTRQAQSKAMEARRRQNNTILCGGVRRSLERCRQGKRKARKRDKADICLQTKKVGREKNRLWNAFRRGVNVCARGLFKKICEEDRNREEGATVSGNM